MGGGAGTPGGGGVRVLFLHPNFPGQFKHLAPRLAARPGTTVLAIAEASAPAAPEGVRVLRYPSPRPPNAGTHRYLRSLESAVRRGQAVARLCLTLKKRGFVPDVVVAHPGWGDALFIRDVFPKTRLLAYAEFHYRSRGADVGFDPEFKSTPDEILALRVRNSVNLMTLDAADWAVSPTAWQRQQFPHDSRGRISVVFDGIDTGTVRPDPAATFEVPNTGIRLARGDEVVTFVNRNLEPYRGFHSFMRALPRLQALRPSARVVVVGGDGVSYGRSPPGGGPWRERMLAELGDRIDLSRVHFVGNLPYARYLDLLRVSAAHLYLTYPFVLGWSMVEAMATGCLIVGSDTAPVREVLRHGENGLLVGFFDTDGIADTLADALARPESHAALRLAAREEAVRKFDLESRCLPAQLAMVDALAAGRRPALDPLGLAG